MGHILKTLYCGHVTETTSYFYYTQIRRTAINKLPETLHKIILRATIGPLVPRGTTLKAFVLSNILLKSPLLLIPSPDICRQ